MSNPDYITNTDTPTEYESVARSNVLETTPFERGIIKAFRNPEESLQYAMEEGKVIRTKKEEDHKDDIKYLLASAERATESKKEQDFAKLLQKRAENKEKFAANIMAARKDAETRKTGRGGKRIRRKSKKTRKSKRTYKKRSHKRRR